MQGEIPGIEIQNGGRVIVNKNSFKVHVWIASEHQAAGRGSIIRLTIPPHGVIEAGAGLRRMLFIRPGGVSKKEVQKAIKKFGYKLDKAPSTNFLKPLMPWDQLVLDGNRVSNPTDKDCSTTLLMRSCEKEATGEGFEILNRQAVIPAHGFLEVDADLLIFAAIEPAASAVSVLKAYARNGYSTQRPGFHAVLLCMHEWPECRAKAVAAGGEYMMVAENHRTVRVIATVPLCAGKGCDIDHAKQADAFVAAIPHWLNKNQPYAMEVSRGWDSLFVAREDGSRYGEVLPVAELADYLRRIQRHGGEYFALEVPGERIGVVHSVPVCDDPSHGQLHRDIGDDLAKSMSKIRATEREWWDRSRKHSSPNGERLLFNEAVSPPDQQ